MRSRPIRAAVLGVVIVLVNVSPADAGVGETAETPSATTELQSRAVSDSQAGYKYAPEGGMRTTSVRAFRVPSIDCASSKAIDGGIGLGVAYVYRRATVVSAALSMYCDGPDSPVYRLGAFVCQFGDGFTDLQPGERVRVSVTQPSDGETTATVTVLSRPDRPTISITSGLGLCGVDEMESVVIGAFAFRDGHGVLPFPDFADTRFNGTKVNGSCLNEDATRIRRVGFGTIKPSPLRNCGFTLRADPDDLTAPDTLTQPDDTRQASTPNLGGSPVYDWAGSALNAWS